MSEVSQTRQSVLYCPYCAEEALFPLERGWECRACLRAFSVTFLGLASRGGAAAAPAGPTSSQETP